MKRRTISLFLFAMLLIVVLIPIVTVSAQETGGVRTPPTTSQEQEMNQRNTVPRNFTTEIIAVDNEGRARAQRVIEVYEVLDNNPTIEGLRDYLADDYIQHNTLLPDGPEPLAMFFAAQVAEYPVEIDVHKVMVLGDWAMAHLNFRRTDTDDPNDLGIAVVDIFTFGPDGKLTEHWDVIQGVPTHSANPHGMFLRVRKED